MFAISLSSCSRYNANFKLDQSVLFMTVRHIFEISENDHPSLVTHATDDRLYQMYHCVSIPMILVSAIFARLSRQMTRATLTANQGAYIEGGNRWAICLSMREENQYGDIY